MQVQYDAATRRYQGPVDCVRQIYMAHGVPGLWRGMSANLLVRSHFAILWSTFEFYTKQFQRVASEYMHALFHDVI